MDARPAFRFSAIPAALTRQILSSGGTGRAIAGIFALSALATIAVVLKTGMIVPAGEVMPFLTIALALFGLAGFCRLRYEDQRLAHAAAIVATAIVGLLLCAILSNAGLRLGAPLADALLASADAAVGIDAGAVVESLTREQRLVALLGFAYNSSGLLVVLLILWSLIFVSPAKAWELVATTVVSMQIVALSSLAFPAWGVMRHFSLEALQGNGLPVGAGTYQWQAFGHFYEGSDPVLRLGDMGGIVAFPSFHTVLALLVTQALAQTPMRWVAAGWTALIILAAIPMGGHYAADLAAGWIVWGASLLMIHRASRPPEPQTA